MTIPQSPPDLLKVINHIENLIGDSRLFGKIFLTLLTDFPESNPAPGGQYRHWETLRQIPPPERLTSKAWWLGIKLARLQTSRLTPLQDQTGHPFRYTTPDPLLEMLHRVDRAASGQTPLPQPATNSQARDRYIQSALIEEAFASSALAGATTTHEGAQALIRSGQPPTDPSERMILNTFRALQFVRAVKEEPLTPEIVVLLHRIITEDTPNDTESALRQPGDEAGLYDEATKQLVHSPPPATEIPQRLETMCRFANEGNPDAFLHPVLRAIMLHFWLAYERPFTDGNGRTARALFYWSMLSQGFGIVDFVSISAIIHQAPAAYVKSFLYTETDDNDLTYFLLAQLRVICHALDALQSYLEQKTEDLQTMAALLKHATALNHRQLALLSHALRHPAPSYTIEGHRMSHKITYQTARTDLLDLADRHLLEKRKRSRAFVFVPVEDLANRMQEVG